MDKYESDARVLDDRAAMLRLLADRVSAIPRRGRCRAEAGVDRAAVRWRSSPWACQRRRDRHRLVSVVPLALPGARVHNFHVEDCNPRLDECVAAVSCSTTGGREQGGAGAVPIESRALRCSGGVVVPTKSAPIENRVITNTTDRRFDVIEITNEMPHNRIGGVGSVIESLMSGSPRWACASLWYVVDDEVLAVRGRSDPRPFRVALGGHAELAGFVRRLPTSTRTTTRGPARRARRCTPRCSPLIRRWRARRFQRCESARRGHAQEGSSRAAMSVAGFGGGLVYYRGSATIGSTIGSASCTTGSRCRLSRRGGARPRRARLLW